MKGYNVRLVTRSDIEICVIGAIVELYIVFADDITDGEYMDGE